jgi:hypothetical protein
LGFVKSSFWFSIKTRKPIGLRVFLWRHAIGHSSKIIFRISPIRNSKIINLEAFQKISLMILGLLGDGLQPIASDGVEDAVAAEAGLFDFVAAEGVGGAGDLLTDEFEEALGLFFEEAIEQGIGFHGRCRLKPPLS